MSQATTALASPTFLGKVEDPEARKSKLAAELANGRLAMMAIIGMFFQVLGFQKLFGTNCYLQNVLLSIFKYVLAGLLNPTCSSLSGKQLETLDSKKCVCSCFTCEDGLTGSAWGDWSLYTASPLRAEDAEEPPKPPPFDPAKQAVFFLHGANYLARNYQYV